MNINMNLLELIINKYNNMKKYLKYYNIMINFMIKVQLMKIY